LWVRNYQGNFDRFVNFWKLKSQVASTGRGIWQRESLTSTELQEWLARFQFDGLQFNHYKLNLDFSVGSNKLKCDVIAWLSSDLCTLGPRDLSVKGEVPRTCSLLAAVARLDAKYGIGSVEFEVLLLTFAKLVKFYGNCEKFDLLTSS
jgi:hypothetical protein